MADSHEYPHAAARTALALILSEEARSASTGLGGTGGFEAVERSATEALLDIFTRFVRTVGVTTRDAAQHAGRSESNLADLLVGLQSVGAGGLAASQPRELLRFLEEEASEVAVPCNLSSFPVVRPPPTAPATGGGGGGGGAGRWRRPSAAGRRAEEAEPRRAEEEGGGGCCSGSGTGGGVVRRCAALGGPHRP